MHYNTIYMICQERNQNMKDDDPERNALRRMIASAAENCTDTATLDLIYKLLTYDSKDENDGA